MNEQVVWTKHNGAQVGEVKAAESVRAVAIFGLDARIIADHVHDLLGTRCCFRPRTALTTPTPPHCIAGGGRPGGLRGGGGTSSTSTDCATTPAAMRYQHAGNRHDELAAGPR